MTYVNWIQLAGEESISRIISVWIDFGPFGSTRINSQQFVSNTGESNGTGYLQVVVLFLVLAGVIVFLLGT